MDITYVFAGLHVANRDAAVTWYERLLGRPPTFLPHDGEAVWQLAETASLYVLAEPDRAGKGLAALVVNDLQSCIAQAAGRGIECGAIEEITGAALKSSITDPDGNVVSLIEITSSSASDTADGKLDTSA